MRGETGRALWTGWATGALFGVSACVDLELATPLPTVAAPGESSAVSALVGAAMGEGGADGVARAELDAGVASVLGRAPLWSKQVCFEPVRASVAGATCYPPSGGDCWDTGDYDTATKTYARGHIRLCDDGLQVAAYAFGGLDLEADYLGADGYFALVEVYDATGRLLGVVTDSTKDDGYGGWKAFPTAASIVVKAYVYAF